MIDYKKFLQEHQPKKKFGTFSDSELKAMEEELPPEVIDFMTNEGICSFSNNFLWTINPDSCKGILGKWGIKESKCATFIRSAFGALIYYNSRNKKFYLFDPLLGRVMDLADNFDDLLNMMLLLDTILENGFFIDRFQSLKVDSQALQSDEVFALVPALPLGGSFETSKVENVKLKEHLLFLAQLFDGKAKRV